jgi:hypothetical protein
MLGRNSYTPEELDHATTAVEQQLTAYQALVKAVNATSDPKAKSALEAFEPLFCNNLTLALDRYFVHRWRWTPPPSAGDAGASAQTGRVESEGSGRIRVAQHGLQAVAGEIGDLVLEVGGGDWPLWRAARTRHARQLPARHGHHRTELRQGWVDLDSDV